MSILISAFVFAIVLLMAMRRRQSIVRQQHEHDTSLHGFPLDDYDLDNRNEIFIRLPRDKRTK
jgi:hypothetical protein